MKLYINANRAGYAPDQIRSTMTVGELIAATVFAAGDQEKLSAIAAEVRAILDAHPLYPEYDF